MLSSCYQVGVHQVMHIRYQLFPSARVSRRTCANGWIGRPRDALLRSRKRSGDGAAQPPRGRTCLPGQDLIVQGGVTCLIMYRPPSRLLGCLTCPDLDGWQRPVLLLIVAAHGQVTEVVRGDEANSHLHERQR